MAKQTWFVRFAQRNRQLAGGFSFALRLGLGCIFLLSSLPKIRQPYDFLSDVYQYELTGPKLGVFVAMTLPWVELFVGVCLVGGIFIGGALLASIAMAAIFSFVIASALHRGLEISCGCFGASGDQIGYYTLIRACGILVVSGAIYICSLVYDTRQRVPHPERSCAFAANTHSFA